MLLINMLLFRGSTLDVSLSVFALIGLTSPQDSVYLCISHVACFITRNVEIMFVYSWTNIHDAGPQLNQHWLDGR